MVPHYGFDEELRVNINKKISHFSFSPSSKGIDIAKFGLALIGEDVQINNEFNTKFHDLLKSYYDDEYKFVNMFSEFGSPKIMFYERSSRRTIHLPSYADRTLFSLPAVKMFETIESYFHIFKEAWLMTECNFLFNSNSNLRASIFKELEAYFFSGLKAPERSASRYYSSHDNVEKYHQLIIPNIRGFRSFEAKCGYFDTFNEIYTYEFKNLRSGIHNINDNFTDSILHDTAYKYETTEHCIKRNCKTSR